MECVHVQLENLEWADFQELHVDRQLLRPGEHFVMDPRNCLALASCLKVLNISGSNVHDLSGLELMAGLVSLSAASNHLSSLEAVLEIVSSLGMLSSLELRDNAKLNKVSMYRTRLIAHGRALQLLDGEGKRKARIMNWKCFPGRHIDQNNRILAQQISAKRGAKTREQERGSEEYCGRDTDDLWTGLVFMWNIWAVVRRTREGAERVTVAVLDLYHTPIRWV